MLYLIPAAKGGIYEFSHPSVERLNSAKCKDCQPYGNETYIFEAFQAWKSYGNGDICSSGLLEVLRGMAILKEVNIDANNQCNLSCRQCYLGYNTLKKPELTTEGWKSIIDQCIALGTQFFAISGKEPFVNDKAIQVLKYVKGKKNGSPTGLSTGLVTNGTLIEPFLDELPVLDLDFIVFSVDGLRKEHDEFRGPGTFDRVVASVKKVVKHNPVDRVKIATIYHKGNIKSLLEMFHYFYELGVRHFFLEPLLPTRGVPAEFSVNVNSFKGMVRDLQNLRRPSGNKDPCDIIIDLCPQNMPDFYEFCVNGEMYLEDLQSDVIGSLFKKIPSDSGADLYLRVYPNSRMVGNVCRITADGHYVIDIKPLTTTEYWKGAIGEVTNQSIGEIFRAVFDDGGPIWQTIINAKTSECRTLPCFPFCQGLNEYCNYSMN